MSIEYKKTYKLTSTYVEDRYNYYIDFGLDKNSAKENALLEIIKDYNIDSKSIPTIRKYINVVIQ